LIQLAPAFFDATKVEYHRLRRAEDARWRAEWEPILNRVYGNPDAPCTPVDPLADHRPFPRCPRIVRAVEHELLTLQLALASAGSAFAACNNRPHHLPSLHLLVRLVNAASAFQELIFGAPRQPEAADQFIPRDPLAELRRAYPDPEPAPPPPAPSATSGSPVTGENAVSSKPETPPAPSPINPAWPPPDDKRDLTPFAMVRGDHGLLCLRRLTNP
jgi:hypothetical protein